VSLLVTTLQCHGHIVNAHKSQHQTNKFAINHICLQCTVAFGSVFNTTLSSYTCTNFLETDNQPIQAMAKNQAIP